MIHALGATDRIVGVTMNDTYPEAVLDLPRVGDQSIDLERVASLQPDLVILDSNFNQNQQALEKLGLRTLELRCKRLDDVPRAMEILGEALGLPDRGKEEAEAFRQTLEDLEPLEIREPVFVEISGTPLMTAGSQTLTNDLLVATGLKNSYQDQTDYFIVDPEDVVSRGPGVIILPAPPDESAPSSAAAELLRKTGTEPRVIRLNPDLFTRPGPRLLQGIESLQNQLKKTH